MRARNGYPNVWAVVLADDDNTIQTLYKFIQEALKLAGTGQVQDLGTWVMGNYAERYLPLIQNKRSWFPNSLGVPDVHRVRVGNRLVMAQALPSAARTPQRQGPASESLQVSALSCSLQRVSNFTMHHAVST